MIRNLLERYRLEHLLNGMLRHGPVHSSAAITVTAREATREAVRDEVPTVLIVTLHEIDDAARSELALASAKGVKVLVLVDQERQAEWGRLAGIPVGGCLSTGELSEITLRTAIARMLRGEVPISANLVHALLNRAQHTHAPTPDKPAAVRMTPREREALELLVDGLSNQQIASRLHISLHGAKRLVSNILAKLDCSNRTSAVTRAVRDGLCDTRTPSTCG
ncbi:MULTISPECIES: response regulator transcription factor [unclassified Streptomyces]|uniref:response regulator transcription factor n=1 Tax=unclassified Streptomyces TaxID=2593676 RepID=UPI0022B6AAFD|nr:MULTISPECIES: LuxR C-terminal-related transcriptional regulator [unclassified Streptomyces]MCZ7413974.1 LuxR C-terminal-related transcriptional regulator [Streptomyces sp. WMMC897]MCZ7430970.1 LuxR C-terminal-related transcriptional regulator [Streptomyces sp. WMMC1477]